MTFFIGSHSIGYVSQGPLLLNDSITNNICLGVEQNKINIQKLNEVIDKTGLRSLINENKNLNNLMIGESGQSYLEVKSKEFQ